MISFIMMARNEEKRIGDAITSLLETEFEFELLIIDDHSVDGTYKVAASYCEKDARVRVFKNKYEGKVKGTNYGFELSRGDLVKCIDADDVLLPEFFEHIAGLAPGCSHCHSAMVVTSDLKPLAKYNVNRRFLDAQVETVIENLVSIPKSFWTFSRDVAEKVFPLPEDMPIEDLWMSLRAKQYSKEVVVTNVPVYLYRQHAGQDYGGVLNYSFEMVKLRAERSLKAIYVLEGMSEYQSYDFSYLKEYLSASINRAGVLNLFFSRLNVVDKVKLILSLHMPKAASVVTRVKWWLDAQK